LGRAVRQEDGRICIYVAPHLVEGSAPLAGVEDVFNCITVKGDAIGDVMFYGRGAGKLPTASAVVADVMDAARHMKTRTYLEWGPGGDLTVSPDVLESAWYVRSCATADAVRAAFGEGNLLARPGAPAGEVAFLTAPMRRTVLDEKLAGLAPQSVIRVLD
jgi:homoserine dehydrogenase